MSGEQLVGMIVMGAGLVQLLLTTLLVVRRRRGDRTAVRVITLALAISCLLSTIGVVIAA